MQEERRTSTKVADAKFIYSTFTQKLCVCGFFKKKRTLFSFLCSNFSLLDVMLLKIDASYAKINCIYTILYVLVHGLLAQKFHTWFCEMNSGKYSFTDEYLRDLDLNYSQWHDGLLIMDIDYY